MKPALLISCNGANNNNDDDDGDVTDNDGLNQNTRSPFFQGKRLGLEIVYKDISDSKFSRPIQELIPC